MRRDKGGHATLPDFLRSGDATEWSFEKQEQHMDKDRVEGAVHQAKGSVKEAAGKVMGDKKTEAEGKAEKAEGKVQNAAGGVKDAVKD
jgi:uncharacterized protein YjbJ (UPF0337 family)